MQSPLPTNLDDILFFEASVNYTKIHFVDGTIRWCSYTIKRYEEKLGEPFYRFHRRFIVNKNFIKHTLTHPHRRVVLHCGREIPVARRR